MKFSNHRAGRGFSLLEVLIAVVVLYFGLLALAALNGSLLRAGAESKARAAASALAQQVIEDARSFSFVSPPVGYTGATYTSLTTWAPAKTVSVGGVDFTVNRTVGRFRPDGSTVDAAAAFDPASPEFKTVDVVVSWTGSDGSAEQVELKDSIASLSPADALNVIKAPLEAVRGPEVWIEPPNKDNPAVVPIAVGDDQSAASSNPIPRRFTKADSNTAATVFNVHTFTGSASGAEVLLNRKLDVAAVTCRCSLGGKSTASNPAFQPVVWNGKQLAYMDPVPMPSGTQIGGYSGGQASKDIDEMCTTCCRDHHESDPKKTRVQRPDPYRMIVSPETIDSEHYLVEPSKTDPNVGVLTGPLSSGEYSEACQMIRVNGRMRVSIDPQQNMLVSIPMNDAETSQEVIPATPTFVDLYSKLVVDYITKGVAGLPTGYLSPTARFPAFDATQYLPTYKAILTPDPILLPRPSDGKEFKRLVTFGLYVDYLSPETRKAYDCAATKDTDASCNGLRDRNPLETLPFYAINVANLGVWSRDTLGKEWLAVTSPSFDNKGILSGEGGVVTKVVNGKQCGSVTLSITKSASGIAGRLPIDPDDNSSANKASDSLLFTNIAGTTSDDCAKLL